MTEPTTQPNRKLAYTVIATCPDEPAAQKYLAWLRAGHVHEVCLKGANRAAIVRLDAPAPSAPVRLEVRYEFPSRAAFDRYVAEFAPALRAEGQRLFGPETGMKFDRTVGEILDEGFGIPF